MNKTNPRPYPFVTVTKRSEAKLRAGHPWVYDNEILTPAPAHENGSLCDVLSEKGAYLGTGFISDSSKIRVRILSTNANESFGDAFFRRRVKYALDYRRTVMRGADYACCRLIFGESDGLPGLTCDRYGDIIVVETLSFGLERVKDGIFRAICEELARDGVRVSGIYERNESPIRALEGLPPKNGWYVCDFCGVPESAVTIITENSVEYEVDVENGQKTGFFLDQKYNRAAAAKIAAGRNVLECFTHTGSFALNAAKAGAAHVTAVDISEPALLTAKRNAERNHLADKIDFVRADVFELLPKLAEEHAPYDYVILDPPAFTKSRKTASDAERGYKEINFRAMKLLPRGGLLATCTCSHFVSDADFRAVLSSAAFDAGISLKMIEARRQSPDHPILINVPETDYLNFYLFQIV